MDLECFTIIDREVQEATRTIKEAMYIQVNDPSLSRNLGKHNLPHLWDEVLRTPLCCNLSNIPTPPLLPTMGTSPTHIPYSHGGKTSSSLVGMVHSPLFPLMGVHTLTPSSPYYTPQTPLTQNYTLSDSILVSRHFIIFVGSTFSHRPDEVALV